MKRSWVSDLPLVAQSIGYDLDNVSYNPITRVCVLLAISFNVSLNDRVQLLIYGVKVEVMVFEIRPSFNSKFSSIKDFMDTSSESKSKKKDNDMSVFSDEKMSNYDLILQKNSEMDDIKIIIKKCIHRLALIDNLKSKSVMNIHIYPTFLFHEIMGFKNKKVYTQETNFLDE
jgi:hypothetical protein